MVHIVIQTAYHPCFPSSWIIKFDDINDDIFEKDTAWDLNFYSKFGIPLKMSWKKNFKDGYFSANSHIKSTSKFVQRHPIDPSEIIYTIINEEVMKS